MGTRVGSALLLPLLLGAVLSGCDSDPAARHAPSARPAATPTALGGPPPPQTSPPGRPMDGLERPVHHRLAAQVAGQGLTLTYLDCPRWDGTVPTRMVCKGYVDGLVARVAVHLRAAVEGKAVGFDARLLDGVIATRKLERTLRHQGWSRADCGDVPAYPAKVGSRIVCHVHRRGDDRYVVATVSDRSGAVMIADYRGPA
jgi:hypothetical protein